MRGRRRFARRGFATNVGGGLPRDGQGTGEEVRAGYWRRANTGRPAVLFPLARYGSRTSDRTGVTSWFTFGSPGGLQRLHDLAGCRCADPTVPTSSGGQNQELVPAPTGGVAFSPAGAFGIALDASGERMFSDDGLNGDSRGHDFRFWPARDRDGSIIPDTWIVGNDLGVSAASLPAKNGDYQAFMWVLSNATPA